MAEYREAIDAALSAVAEAGAGGRAYRHLGELLTLFSARFAAVKERRAGIDFEDLQILAASLLEGPSWDPPIGRGSATCSSTSSRTRTASSCG